MRRLLTPVVCAAAIACGSGKNRPAVTRLSQEATATDPKLESCDLDLSDGKLPSSCGTLVVPELRSDKESATLRIPFQRSKQGDGTPLLYIGDGPGSSAYQFMPPTALVQGRDLLLVGARGIDGGRSLDCPEVGIALKGPSSSWIPEVPKAFDNCMTRYKQDGVRLEGYGVLERVADLVQALELNGITKVHLVADGFGAVLALTFARLHPEQVERIVLIAPTPAEQPVGSSKDAERVLRSYDASVADAVRDLPLPARWMIYGIDRERVRLATSMQLAYRRGALASVGAWSDALHGDYAGIAQVSWGAEVMLGSSFVWGEVVPMLASLDPDGVEMVDGDPTLPSATLVTALGGLGLVARALPEFPPLPTGMVDKPTLVIHGDLDPRYSPETTAAAMRRALSQPTFTRIAGYGSPSELWAVAPDLLTHTITSFLDGGAAPSDLAPPLSPPTIRLSTLAKLILTAMAAFPLAGGVLVFLLFRRLRRTMARDAARQSTPRAPVP